MSRQSVFLYDRAERRLWLLGQRIHHGTTGIFACLIGIMLIVDDRHDWRYWFVRESPQSRSQLIDNVQAIA